MRTLVGIPCGIAVQFILGGGINIAGVLASCAKGICDRLRVALEHEDIGMIEKVL